MILGKFFMNNGLIRCNSIGRYLCRKYLWLLLNWTFLQHVSTTYGEFLRNSEQQIMKQKILLMEDVQRLYCKFFKVVVFKAQSYFKSNKRRTSFILVLIFQERKNLWCFSLAETRSSIFGRWFRTKNSATFRQWTQTCHNWYPVYRSLEFRQAKN